MLTKVNAERAIANSRRQATQKARNLAEVQREQDVKVMNKNRRLYGMPPLGKNDTKQHNQNVKISSQSRGDERRGTEMTLYYDDVVVNKSTQRN